MGLDFECLTVRLDNDPMRRIRADPSLWAVVEDQPPFCGPWPGAELPEITRQLLAVHRWTPGATTTSSAASPSPPPSGRIRSVASSR
jgi:hypothetical protein